MKQLNLQLILRHFSTRKNKERVSTILFKQQKGFTLLEVLAAIIILSTLLLAVINLLNFNNKVSVSNTENLVAINLAKASIERIKAQENKIIKMLPELDEKEEIEFTKNHCINPQICDDLFEVIINDKKYEVKYYVSQLKEEKELGLIDLRVEVLIEDKLVFSEVEGYLND